MTINRLMLSLAVAALLVPFAGCSKPADHSLAILPHTGMVFTSNAMTDTKAEGADKTVSAQAMRFGVFQDDQGSLVNRATTNWPKDCKLDNDGGLSTCSLDTNNLVIDETFSDPNTPSTYILEAFGSMNVYSTQDCTSASQCDTGWKCDTVVSRDGAKNCWKYIPGRGKMSLPCETTKKFNFCYVTIPGAVTTRGTSSETIYDGGSATNVPLYFTRVIEPVLATKADGSLSSIAPAGTTVESTGLVGHESYVLPDGKVVLLGGASQDRTSRDNKTRIPTLLYTKNAQLFDPADNSVTTVAVSDSSSSWVSRIDFTLTPYDAPPALYGTTVTSDRPTEAKLVERFLVVGGRKGSVDKTSKDLVNLTTAEVYADVYIGRYDASIPAITLQKVAGDMPARFGHTTTYLGNGKFVVTGGLDKDGNELTDIYLIDTYAPVPYMTKLSANLTAGRYKHTATLLWTPPADCSTAKNSDLVPMIVVLGGMDKNGGSIAIKKSLNYITINGETATVEEAPEDSTLDFNQLARIGHIAVPVMNLEADGTIKCESIAKARVVFYGGYKANSDTKDYFNFNSTGNVIVSTAAADKSVSFFNWPRPTGYMNAMDSSIAGSNFPCDDPKWVWMDARHTKILVAGGMQNGTGTSAWAEVLALSGDRFSTFTFGTRDSDKHDTPFRLGLLPEGLARFGLVRLPTGLYVFTGGLGYNIVEKRYYVTDKTATLNQPNTQNVWANTFQPLPFD